MFLLDTNVISELRKARSGRANAGVERWIDGVNHDDLYVSVMTIEELELGILLAERRDPAQGSLLRSWMSTQVLPAFEDRILPIDHRIAILSARLHVPDPKPVRDALIAATALEHRMTLVTRNAGDFQTIVPDMINPWR